MEEDRSEFKILTDKPTGKMPKEKLQLEIGLIWLRRQIIIIEEPCEC